MDKLVLIDGNSLLNRAFYATPLFTSNDGLPTNGIFGFIKLLLKIISDKKPKYLAVAFDLHAPTFRHKMYDCYKAGRKPMPQELAMQVPVLKELLRLMRIKTVEKEGFEADDLIGTLSRKFAVHSYIYTGDRDSYQLVCENVNVCFTRKGVSDIWELNENNFTNEVGITPSQIIDLKSLMGDKSDNIPGVNGVGELTAKNLLQKYTTLKGVYEHLWEITGALKKRLEDGKEQAELSYRLATIKLDVPIECELQDCELRMPFPYAVRQKFAELDFRSLVSLNCFESLQASADQTTVWNAAQTGVESEVDKFADTQEKNAKKAEFSCEKSVCSSLALAISAAKSCEGTRSACVFMKSAVEFVCQSGKSERDVEGSYIEYVVPIKESLIDEGIFEGDMPELLSAIFSVDRTVVCYNVKSVLKILKKHNVAMKANLEDVGLLRYIADGASDADELSFLLDARGFNADFPALGVLRLYDDYLEKVSEEEKKLYREIELPLVNVLFDMEETGVCVNIAMINELSVRYNQELGRLSEQIFKEAGEEFNINSPVQLGKILFEKLKIQEKEELKIVGSGSQTKKTKVKKLHGTSAEILEKYAADNEIVRLVLRYRQVQKLNSTYIDGIRSLVVDGRVHTTYNQSSTATGRLSSANPNLQNIPIRTDEGRELRKLFTASDNHVFIDADYSQIELRLMAHFSNCSALKTAYQNGEDIHALTASQVFCVPISEVTPAMRRAAKAVNFGIIYGISAFGLANDLGISTTRAKEYIDKYFETYSEVKTYIDNNVENAKKNGFVTTLYGRKREIVELKSSNFAIRAFGERAAMNMPLQGTSADIIKIAMVRVQKRLKSEGLKAKLVLQVHDELVLDCPVDELVQVKTILQYEMEHAAELSVPLVVEIGVGKNWFEAH